MLSIPIQNGAPNFSQTTTIDGTDYLLSFWYNQREARYYFSVGLPDGTKIASGAPLVCQWPLFSDVRGLDPNMPTGVFYVYAATTPEIPPGLGEMGPGKRCELIYVEQAELPPAIP